MSASFRDQIKHWRDRALVAEEANAKAAEFIEQERKRAEGAIKAAGEAQATTSRVLYMAGSDAAGMRLALDRVVARIESGELRVSGATNGFRISTKALREKAAEPILAELKGALSGEAGKRWREEANLSKAREIALAQFADKIDDLVEGFKPGGRFEARPRRLDLLLDNLDDLLDEVAEAIGAKRGKPPEEGEKKEDLTEEGEGGQVVELRAGSQDPSEGESEA